LNTTLVADPYRTGAFEGTLSGWTPRFRRHLPDWYVEFGPSPLQPIRDARSRIRDIQRMTGWSDRVVARVLGVTHPTVAALKQGRRGRVPVRARLLRAHDLAERVFLLTGRDQLATQELFEQQRQGISAFSLLADDKPADAYLAITEAIHPPRSGLVVGRRPAEAGNATTPLYDET